ncbi:sialic acid-binding Ig-like lectin 14 [Protopterus annectens]|uniref:sialic acid-binding Ig-like lectin 14 n=1 Tax=Protopterus annectens TaxID=7888 RepID=UPI001CFC1C3A|nr:sialic acid-binding Ig-like lectin 14 [Protopterus annectens]
MDFFNPLFAGYILLQVLIQNVTCEWNAYSSQALTGIQGSCVVIPCTFNYPGQQKQSDDITTIWFKDGINVGNKIYDSRMDNNSEGYKYLLVGDVGQKNCSFKINRLNSTDKGNYYLRVEIKNLDKYTYANNFTTIAITDKPEAPKINFAEEVIEMKRVNATCTITNTCRDSPPKFIWNRSNATDITEATFQNENMSAVSILEFTPSSKDNGKVLKCDVEYPNIRRSSTNVTLNVLYKPKINQSYVCTVNQIKFTCYCEIDSNPIPSVIWHLPNKNISENSTDDNFKSHSFANGTIITSIIEGPAENINNVTCSAYNCQGFAEQVFAIQQQLSEHTSLQIICIASSAAGLLVIIVTTALIYKQCHKRRNKSGSTLGQEVMHNEDIQNIDKKIQNPYCEIQQKRGNDGIYSNELDKEHEDSNTYTNYDPSSRNSCLYANLEQEDSDAVYANT